MADDLRHDDLLLKYIAFWFVLAVLAIANGVLRGSTYGVLVSERTAHQISTLTGVLLTGVAVGLFHRYQPTASLQQAWSIGAIWLVLTVAFEFGFGRFVAGHSWDRLVADYNLLAGRVWLLFLAWIVAMVPLFHVLSRD